MGFQFAQIPDFLIFDKKITPLQFRIFACLEFFRFAGFNDIDSNLIGEKIGVNRDTVRHQLNLLKDLIDPELIAFHFIPQGYGKTHLVKVHFNYIKNKISVTNPLDIEYDEILILKDFLKSKSKLFNENHTEKLFEYSNTKKASEIVKGIIFIDNLKKVPVKPFGYFRSSFHEGTFKYEIKFKDQISLNTHVIIKDRVFYELEKKDFETFKSLCKSEYKCRLNYFENKDSIIIFSGYYPGFRKQANLKNLLTEFKINFKMFC